MKKFLFFIVCSLLLLMSNSSLASITGSAHDFSGFGWSQGQICVPCHTPHNADTSVADAPLWNHEVTTVAAYTLYTSSTLNAVVGQPNGVSKLCLSCHDGTVAVDSFGGVAGTTNVATFDGGGLESAGYALLDTDLSNDHPVSFTYDSLLAASDGELTDPSADGDVDPNTVGAAAPYVQLFSGKVECSSCHDVHNTAGNSKLLVMDNAGSSLCLKCHTK